MVDRDYIIKRIKSKGVTVGEFNFDRLQAPRLIQLLRPWDIQELEDISRSIRLSSNLKKKYELYNQILNPRGFRKFVSGTNRVCYEYIEDKSFMLKVAVDAVGMKDNPCEFRNQFIFKPFVPKIFDVSQRGTLGICERVNPITNEEEFRAVADDIYTVINEIFVGEYVLADIGTKFFMNWGIREGFGPVLLDFPYVYKLDGKKLFCNASDPYSKSGCCNGTIDYDAGYNFLVCTKCGKQYKASDLRSDGESRKLIIREQGGYKMKVRISGGTKEVKKTIKVNEDGSFAKVDTMPVSNIIKPTVETAPKIEKKEEEIIKDPEPKKEEKKEREVPKEKSTMAVNGVSNNVEEKTKEEVISPITFVTDDEKAKTMEKILDHINQIRSLSGLLTDDEAFDLSDIILDVFTELENRPNNARPHISSFLKYIEKCSILMDKFSEADKKNAMEDEFVKDIVDIYLEYNPIETSEIEDEDIEVEAEDLAEDDSEENTVVPNNKFALVNAVLENLKDVDPNQNSKKVLIITDDDGNYLYTSDGSIIGIDTISNRSIDSISIVSKEWLENIQRMINSEDATDNIIDDDEDDIVETVEGNEDEE